ncbi:MAG: hypothetical protein MRZ30_06895, partial [Oscillospiraceae bacterium]|nr:hypothetical protein [Oscillospiraceae bacterium]
MLKTMQSADSTPYDPNAAAVSRLTAPGCYLAFSAKRAPPFFIFYCFAIKTILMAVPLVGAHGRKNSLRFSAAIFLLLRNKNDFNGRT